MNLKKIFPYFVFTKITNMKLNFQYSCLTDLSKYNKDPYSFDNNFHIFDSLSTIICKGNKDSEFTTLFSSFRLDLRSNWLNQSVSYVDII